MDFLFKSDHYAIGDLSVKKNSWTVAAALIAGLFLPITEARASVPIVITTQAQLLQINNDREGSYILGASFTLSSTPDGTSTYVTDVFSGTFNGNGFTLSGLTGSLFSVVAGSVSNLNLVTATAGITTYAEGGSCLAGVLAGELGYNFIDDEDYYGVIDGVKVSGALTIDGDCGATGGLIGRATSRTTILNSSSSVSVNSNDPNVGGLVGSNRASITNSSSSGNVIGGYQTGGLVGKVFGGSIDASFSTATVSGGERTGGLIGASASRFTTVSRSAISGPLESLIGFSQLDDGDGRNYEIVVSDVGASDTDIVTNPSEWDQNQYINSGIQYIKALKAIGFYTDTTPSAPSGAALEAAAKAAEAAAAAKREAEVKAARVDITSKLAKSEKFTLDNFKQAEIAGVTADNFASVQAEILALPAESRTDITQILKVARKFEVVGKMASEQIARLPMNLFVEVGLIPADSKYKTSLISEVRLASASERDSFAEIQKIIAAETAKIQTRKDRLSSLIARSESFRVR